MRKAKDIAQNCAYLLLFAGRFVLFPLWWLGGLVPRRRNLWVFGSWGGYRFADNAASFFRYCHGHLQGQVRLVWISRDPAIVRRLRQEGFEAHLNWSPRGMAACLRSGIHLFDCFAKDTNYWLGRGAIKVNLWSGVPLKTFEREIDLPSNRYYRLFHGSLLERTVLGMMMPWHVERPDLIIATSNETAAITRRAFDVPAERVVVTGFPRNDALLAAQPADAELPASFTEALARGEKVFLYLPTFRDSGNPYHQTIDWAGLNHMLAARNARLFCKFHPVAKTSLPATLDRVIELPQDIDVYPLLPHTDALISDYSSVIFDYMLLDRPIVYFTPDLQSFVKSSRRLSFQPEEIAVGPLCASNAELLAALDAIARGESPQGPRRRSDVLARLFTHVDAAASRRVMAIIAERWLAREVSRLPAAAR